MRGCVTGRHRALLLFLWYAAMYAAGGNTMNVRKRLQLERCNIHVRENEEEMLQLKLYCFGEEAGKREEDETMKGKGKPTKADGNERRDEVLLS